MQVTEKQVKMAAKLYEMRDTAKRLLRDKYAAKMTEYGEILQATAERDSRTPMEVAIAVSYKNDTPAMEICFIMAAAVELAEPSTDMRE